MRMLIVNPIAGCGYALKVMEQVQSVLTARNLPFRVMRTEYPGYAAKLAREAVEMGCEAVYVIGGDGTFSEAARGLAGSGIPIGLIPAGTGNDFVKTLGTPKEPMAALDFILSHEPRLCDAIDLNGQLFLNVAGAGFDVTVLENVADFGGKIRRAAAVPRWADSRDLEASAAAADVYGGWKDADEGSTAVHCGERKVDWRRHPDLPRCCAE